MNSLTNNRWLSVIIFLLLTANIVTLFLLWTHKSGNNNSNNMQPPSPNGQVFEFITTELQLDTAQQQTYKILREEHQERQRPLQYSIRKAKDNFFALLQQPAAPDSLIQILSSKVATAQQQLEIFTFKHFQKLRAICSAGQQKKLDTIIRDVLRRMASGRRPQGPPPNGMPGNMPPRGEGERPPNGMPPPPTGKK
jgi:periplasmic protein CpxP/Spy